MKTILAPVDFSPTTNAVAAAAIKLARLLKGKVVLLHIVTPPAAIRDVLPAVEDVELRRKSTANQAEKQLAELKRRFGRRSGAIEVQQLSGSPVSSIIDKARATQAEYIVMGSHGHSAVYDVLMGSVASGVVKKASCPVLIIPPPPCAET